LTPKDGKGKAGEGAGSSFKESPEGWKRRGRGLEKEESKTRRETRYYYV